jgi:predicted transcriptional regulator
MADADEDALAELEFLAASPNRLGLLDALSAGPMTSETLGDSLDLPRSTLQRNLSALAERGYVTHQPTANQYEITTSGQLARRALADALSTVTAATDLAPFLEQFPVELPVEPETLADCEVILATTDDPYDPVSTVKRAIGVAGEGRGFFPTVNPVYLESVRKYDSGEVPLEVITTPAAYDALSTNYGSLLDRLTAVESVELYESREVPGYALVFAGETLLLGAFDDHMRMQSVLRAPQDSPLCEWAQQQYAELEDTATPLE